MVCTVTVLFPNDINAEYDIDYYTNTHMTQIEKLWTRFSLRGWSVTKFIPDLDGSAPLYAFGSEILWESEEGMRSAFASPEAAKLMRDIARFSNRSSIFIIGQNTKPASGI